MKIYLQVFCLFLVTGQACFADTAKFITLADIHFNPFYNCKGTTGCATALDLQKAPATKWQQIFEKAPNQSLSHYDSDTNYPLLKSSLEDARKINNENHAKFIFILGDFLAHEFREKFVLYTKDKDRNHYQNFVKKTFEFLDLECKQAFDDTPIIPLIGNNDSYTGDYNVAVNGEFYSDLAVLWQQLLMNLPHKNFSTTFKESGFYSLQIDKQNQILVLNSVLFSSHEGKDRYNKEAHKELQWLAKQLNDTEKHHGHALIAMHIPPGINNFAVFTGGIKNLWLPEYEKLFSNILSKYKNTISAVLAGHIHIDSMGVVSFSHPPEIIFSYTGSISPIFGNNPSFKIYSYNTKNLRPITYEEYELALNNSFMQKGWQKEFHFSHSF